MRPSTPPRGLSGLLVCENGRQHGCKDARVKLRISRGRELAAAMTQQVPNHWQDMLDNWNGFSIAGEIRAFLTDNEYVDRIEDARAGVTGRLRAVLDLVEMFRQAAAVLVPESILTTAEGNLTQVMRFLTRAKTGTAEQLAPSLQNATAQMENAIQTLRPYVQASPGPEVDRLLEDTRSTAQSTIHGIKTSAGKAISDLRTSTDDVLGLLENHRAELETAVREAVNRMTDEAAEARVRMETALEASRTNAEAQIEQLRQTAVDMQGRSNQEYQKVMDQFAEDVSQLEAVKQELAAQLQAVYSDWARSVETWAAENRDAANSARESLEAVKEWADEIRGDIQIAALAAGFHEKEVDHRKRALIALISAGVLAVLGFAVAFGGFWIYYTIKPDASSSEVARDIALRILLTVLPLTAAGFAARVYRTHSHLATVYGERAAAAKAFEGFAHRASDDAVRDQLLVALAQLVFAGRDTGHHSDETLMPSTIASAALAQVMPKKP